MFFNLKQITLSCSPIFSKGFAAVFQNCQKSNLINKIQIRNYPTSFFVKTSAEQLWKGVTSVSNAGRKRGRAKGVSKRSIKDLNRGQIIGVGKINMLWPGLNAPIIQGKEIVQQKLLPPNEDREERIRSLRDKMGKFKALKLNPLERGWSGSKMHGRSAGPPDPIGQDAFENFDTKILEMKTVMNMESTGRKRRFCVVAFTGNKNGLIGFGIGRGLEGRGALRKSKNRAGQRLLYIERYKNHTILHDFFTQFGATKIFVSKKPEGFGLVCHRAIKAMCELAGIKDLYAKIEGPVNLQHIVKAFVLGLLRQKSYQDIADDKKLYLVERREENYYFPSVVAVPKECRKEEEISTDENLDFSQYIMDDRIVQRRKPYVPFYVNLPTWQNHRLKTEWRRNHFDVVLQLTKNYGFGKSHLTAKYPECDIYYASLLHKRDKAKQEQETSE